MGKLQAPSRRTVLMGRKSPSVKWNPDLHLICICEKYEVAWRSAAATEAQERRLGNPQFEVIVVPEDDFDAGKYRGVRAPRDFDLQLPEAPSERKAAEPPPAPKPPEPEPKPEPEPEEPTADIYDLDV